MIVCLIGASGVGKSTVARRLDSAGEVWVVPTYTTRPPRPEERWGSVDHRFCDADEFDAMLADGRFAATGELPGLGHRYGLPTLPRGVDRPLLVVGRARNVAAVQALGRPTRVYQLEVAADTCRSRIAGRGTSVGELEVRAQAYWSELASGRGVADRIFVNDTTPEALATEVAAAIRHDWKDLT